MKKEIIVHLFSLLLLILLAILLKRIFDFSLAIQFILGAIFGTMLPDIDHFIYVYFLKPDDLTSMRVRSLNEKSQFARAIELLGETRDERTDLVFHSVIFQLIFFCLSFFVVSSSGSPFGRGLVIAFAIHLLADQIIDILKTGNLNNWFRDLPVQLDLDKTRLYVFAVSILTLLLFLLV